MACLLDTNVLSELRRGSNCDPRVRAWAQSLGSQPCFISVLSLGEIRRGIETLRRKSADQVPAFEGWMERLLTRYEDRILPINEHVADQWGRMNAVRSLPVTDGLLAATASHFRLALATRNLADFPQDLDKINPWDFAG